MFSSWASMGDSLSKIFLKFTHLSSHPSTPSTSYLELCSSLLTALSASALAMPHRVTFWKHTWIHISALLKTHHTQNPNSSRWSWVTWPSLSLQILTSYLSHSNLCSSHLASSQFLLPGMLCPSLAKMALRFQYKCHLLRVVPKYFLQLLYVIGQHPLLFPSHHF